MHGSSTPLPQPLPLMAASWFSAPLTSPPTLLSTFVMWFTGVKPTTRTTVKPFTNSSVKPGFAPWVLEASCSEPHPSLHTIHPLLTSPPLGEHLPQSQRLLHHGLLLHLLQQPLNKLPKHLHRLSKPHHLFRSLQEHPRLPPPCPSPKQPRVPQSDPSPQLPSPSRHHSLTRSSASAFQPRRKAAKDRP